MPSNFGVEEEGRSLNLLSNEEANSGKHGNTSVGQLGFTVTLHGSLVGLLGESEGIEETDRGKNTRKFGGDESLEGGGLVGGLSRGEGGGRANKSEEGSSEHHFVFCGVIVFAIRRIVRQTRKVENDLDGSHAVTAGFAYDVEANTSIHKQDLGASSASRSS